MLAIAIDDLPDGAVLAQPLLDANGRVLLRAGTVLTSGLIERLHAWKIHMVTVETAGANTPAVATAERGAVFAIDRAVVPAAIFPAGHTSVEAAILERAFAAWRSQATPPARKAGPEA